MLANTADFFIQTTFLQRQQIKSFTLDENLKFYHGYNISLPRYAKLFHYDMMIIPRFSPTSPQPFSY